MKRRSLVILPMLLFTMAASPIPAMAATYTTEVTNNISMGDINISINEFEHDGNGNEVSYKDGKMVVPGQKIDKIIRINNNANKAWVRAKLSYSDWNGFKGLSDDDVELASDSWIKRGDYYYCITPVDKDKYVDLIKAVNIPSDWKEDRSNGIFQIFTSVDAVQTANFTPDFGAEDPWFGTIIEECVHTTQNVKTESTDKPFSVVFEGGSSGIVKVGDDFFSNWASLMPGDTVSDKVTIGNNYSRGVSIYFHNETLADDALAKAVQLTIRSGDKILYEGSLSGAMEKKVSLGYFSKGETGEITYTLSVPAELTNKYALANTKTKWVFECYYSNGGGGGGGNTPTPVPSTQPETKSSTGGGGGGGSSNNSEVTPDSYGDLNELYRKWELTRQDIIDKALPRLGENKTTVIAVIGGLVLLLGGGIVAVKKKKDKKEDGNED